MPEIPDAAALKKEFNDERRYTAFIEGHPVSEILPLTFDTVFSLSQPDFEPEHLVSIVVPGFRDDKNAVTMRIAGAGVEFRIAATPTGVVVTTRDSQGLVATAVVSPALSPGLDDRLSQQVLNWAMHNTPPDRMLDLDERLTKVGDYLQEAKEMDEKPGPAPAALPSFALNG